jgi:hypothetical protein
MPDTKATDSPPAGLAAVLAIFASFAIFLALTGLFYARHRPAAPKDQVPDRLPATLAWEATPAGRKAYLDGLRASQAAQASSYGWVDRSAGIVQLPIDRAMDLTVKAYAKK